MGQASGAAVLFKYLLYPVKELPGELRRLNNLYLCCSDHLVGLVVKASELESGRSRVRIPLAPGFFRGRVIPVT